MPGAVGNTARRDDGGAQREVVPRLAEPARNAGPEAGLHRRPRRACGSSAYDFTSQEPFRLRLYVAHRDGLKEPELVVLNVLDEEGWKEFLGTYRAGFEGELKDASADGRARPPTQGL